MNDIIHSEQTLGTTDGPEDEAALNRRTLVKSLVYIAPAIVTVAVAPAFAAPASGGGGGSPLGGGGDW